MSDTSDPAAIAQRLSRYVDELVEARIRGKAVAVRGRTQLVLWALEKLRASHRSSPLPDNLVARIRAEKERAQLDVPETAEGYENICWDCHIHGSKVFVDNRVDPVCKTCGWVQCPECGACRDPQHGGCPDRFFGGK